MSERSLSPTVYGIETEYSCMITLPGDVVHEIVGMCHSVDSQLDLYEAPQAKGADGIPSAKLSDALLAQGLVSTTSGMLSNGGRFYIDPSGPEYATPETASAQEAVHRTFDGDEILLSAFKHLQEQGIIADYQVNRRIVDHNRSSRGIHLNTTTALPTGELDDSTKQGLATLNIVKGAVFGSGGLLVDEEGKTAFHHSPRLSLTTDIAEHYSSYMMRPLVRYPFKEDGSLSRIETVSSDALNFAWPLRASLVVTNAFSKLLELGYDHVAPELIDPIESAHIVGRYGNHWSITTIDEDGEDASARPLEILTDICSTILRIDLTEGYLDDESRQVINEVIQVCDSMSNDMYSVANQVESVARLVAIKKKMGKTRLRLDSEGICRFDYAWDWLGGGIAERLRDKNLAGWQGFDLGHSVLSSRKRRNLPPQDTRAKLRGEAIARNGSEDKSDWSMVDSGGGIKYLVHPRSADDSTDPKKP